MAYATTQDALDKYGLDYVASSVILDVSGDPDETALADAFDTATDLINSYLSTRYDVPLATVPTLVAHYCVDIGLFVATRGPGGGKTESHRERYDDALTWLRAVSKGIASLEISESSDPESSDSPEYTTGTRVISRTTLAGCL